MLLIYYVHEGNLYIPGNTDNKKKKKLSQPQQKMYQYGWGRDLGAHTNKHKTYYCNKSTCLHEPNLHTQ